MSIAASTLDVQNLSTGDFDLAVGYHLLCIRKKNDGTFQREFCQLTANTLFGLGATLPSLFPFADFAGAQALADETTARAAADTTNANTAAGKITADPSVTFYRDRATTTSATATVIRSLPMAVNSQIFIDVIAQFRDSATNLTGGYIWATLSFARGGIRSASRPRDHRYSGKPSPANGRCFSGAIRHRFRFQCRHKQCGHHYFREDRYLCKMVSPHNRRPGPLIWHVQ